MFKFYKSNKLAKPTTNSGNCKANNSTRNCKANNTNSEVKQSYNNKVKQSYNNKVKQSYNNKVKQFLYNIVTSITPLQDIIIEYNNKTQLIKQDLLQSILAYSKLAVLLYPSLDYMNDPIIGRSLRSDYPGKVNSYSYQRLYEDGLLKYLPQYILTLDEPRFDLEFVMTRQERSPTLLGQDIKNKDIKSINKNKDVKDVNKNKDKDKTKSESNVNSIFSYSILFDNCIIKSCLGLIREIIVIVLGKLQALGVELSNIKFNEMCITDYSSIDIPLITIYVDDKLDDEYR